MDEERERLLKPLRAQVEEIRNTLNESIAAAEEAVDRLLTNQLLSDYLREKESTERLLQQIVEQAAPASTLFKASVAVLRKQESKRVKNTSVASLKIPSCPIIFNKPYKVEMISPGHLNNFWLRLVGSSIREMEKRLEVFYSTHECLSSRPELGSYVICFSEGKFSRATVTKILNISVDAEKYEVFLVDYGRTQLTSIKNLFAVHENFCKEPAMALLCTLGLTKPMETKFGAVVFFFDQSDNLTATFHTRNENHGSPNPCPIFHISLQKTEITTGSSRILDVRSLLTKGTASKAIDKPATKAVNANQTGNELGVQVPDLKKQFVNSTTPNHGSRIDFYADPKFDSKWDRPCYTTINRQPTLSRQGRRSEVSGSISAASQIFGSSSFKESQLDPNTFEFQPVSSFLAASPMQNLQANHLVSYLPHQEATAGPFNCLASTSNMPSAGVVPTYRAVSYVVSNPPRFNASTSPVMPTAATLQRSPSHMTLRPPGALSSLAYSDIESLLLPSSNNVTVPTTYMTPPPLSVNISAVTPAPVATLLQSPSPIRAPFAASQRISDPQLSIPAQIVTADRAPMSPQLPPGTTGSDPVLMEKYLNACLQNTVSEMDDSASFITASAHDSDRLTIDYSGEDGDGPRILQYDPELTLSKRSVPDVGSPAFLFSLTCIHSPSSFFIRIDDDIGRDWEQLNDTLGKVYRSAAEFCHETDPETGSFWVAQDLDGRWKRVEILETNSQPKSAAVLFVDYGHVTRVLIRLLRPLVPEVTTIPSLAVYCKLAGVYPVNGDEHSVAWSDDAIAEFMRLCSREEKHSGLPAGVDIDTLEILFFDRGDQDKLTVNELLVKQGLADSYAFRIREFSEFDGWDPMREDFYSARNTLALDTENYDSVTAGYIPQDELRICRFFRATGSCYKGISCSQLHAVPDSRAFTSDTTEVYGWVAPLQQPSLAIGSFVSIKISSVVSANHFYAVLCSRNKSRNDGGENYETLESLQEALQEEYSSKYLVHRYPTEEPVMGDVVVAQNPIDGKWYRGRVLDNLQRNGCCKVVFFDFGFVKSVSSKKICKPLPRFLYLPIQSFECFLHGVVSSETSNTLEGRQIFSKVTANKTLNAYVVEREPYLLVDLYDSSHGCKNDVDIAKELVARGVAKAVEKKSLGRRLKAAVIAAG